MVISKRKILKTTLLPEYWPRLRQLFGSGFGNLSFLIALVYNTVRIIPDKHPYLDPKNKGKYNIRQAIVEASNNIVFKKQNIDQIIVFFSIIAALIILVIQIFLLFLSFLVSTSFAQALPDKYNGFDGIKKFFETPNPETDVAFSLLNLVFGIPDFFGGDDSITEPIHTALHGLFNFYSYGMLIVGSFIILYMIVTTVAETAQSGTPFGRRFNKSWAPIRIVLFFALLLPMTLGLNAAQYITLLSAKLGSGLASQGWLTYNEIITEQKNTLTGKAVQNIAIPKMEDLVHIPAFMMHVKTCAFGYDYNYNDGKYANGKLIFPASWAAGVQPWAVYRDASLNWVAEPAFDTTISTLAENSAGRDIHIVFGFEDPTLYEEQKAAIGPVCGSIVFKITDVSQPGPEILRTTYFELIESLWNGAMNYSNEVDILDDEDELLYIEFAEYAENFAKDALNFFDEPDLNLPDKNHKIAWNGHFKKLIEGDGTGENGIIKIAIDAQVGDADEWAIDDEILNLGWAGAGIWYNKIAENNGAFISALRNTPDPLLRPRVMEQNKIHNKAENRGSSAADQYRPMYAPGSPVKYNTEYESEISNALSKVDDYWNRQDSGYNPEVPKTGNAFIDVINLIFGTQGLFELCRNTDIQPLAQLSSVGKSMIDNSIKAFGGTALFTLFGIAPVFQQTTDAISGFFSSVATMGLMIGFVLFYVLPFMPFIYFFFAVGAWVKTIFEAMVGLPLWALAHLRIDGEGIMGDAAMNGYYLIFEIFIRPIIIVFGLIASVIIFAVMIKALNQIFYLVISSLSGHDPVATKGECFNAPTTGENPDQVIPIEQQQAYLSEAYRGPVDEFFFTIIYAITVYIIGTSCFKLIDGIPNSILRWMSAETSSFADNAGDAAEGLMKYATLGGQQFGSQLGASLGGIGKGAQKSGRDILTSELLG